MTCAAIKEPPEAGLISVPASGDCLFCGCLTSVPAPFGLRQASVYECDILRSHSTRIRDQLVPSSLLNCT